MPRGRCAVARRGLCRRTRVRRQAAEVEGIVLLFGAREGEIRRFEAPGCPRSSWAGSTGGGGRPDRPRGAASRSHRSSASGWCRETGGNPLALLELSSSLSEEQLSGAESVLAPIPVSARVERAFLARVHQLPEETQTLMLVAAADDSGEVATVLRAAAQLQRRRTRSTTPNRPGSCTSAETSSSFATHSSGPRSTRRRRSPAWHPQHASQASSTVKPRPIAALQHRAATSIEPDPSVGEGSRRRPGGRGSGADSRPRRSPSSGPPPCRRTRGPGAATDRGGRERLARGARGADADVARERTPAGLRSRSSALTSTASWGSSR